MGEHQMGIHHSTSTAQPNGISLPPGTILGYRADDRPIYVIAGGAEGDDNDTDFDVEIDDTPEGEPADDPEPEPEPEPKPEGTPKPKPPAKKDEPEPWKPPSEAEWRKTQAALKKSNEDGKRHRLRNKELEDAARANETDHEKALREAREEGEKKFREPMKRSGVRAALAEAGFASPDRLLKLVDWDAISVDDEGDLIGVEAEVDRVKADYPELLPQDKPKPKPRPTGAPKQAAPDKPKNSWEVHATRILGKA
ncbi:phage scaffolding protein [Streptomyces spinosisporus]